MNQKPAWLIYAEEERDRISSMKDTKSGKRSEVAMRMSWQTACDKKGYRGAFADWEYLMRRQPRR